MESLLNSYLFAKRKTKSRSKSSLLNSCTLSAKSKTKFKSKSKSKYSDSSNALSNAKSKTKFKSKSKSKYSDSSKALSNAKSKTKSKSKSKYSESSKALSNAESRLMKSANAQPKCMFLVSHSHNLTVDYFVISTEGNSFRQLHDDDDDLPRNLLSLLRFDNCSIRPTYAVLDCCGSLIWLIFHPKVSTPQHLVWDMETDSCRYRFPCLCPGNDDRLNIWTSGMGFDPSSGHCKLLIVWADDYFRQVCAEVLNLGTGSCKAVHYPYASILNPDRRDFNTYPSTPINGFHYQITTGFRDGSSAIVPFDFAKDRFRALIPLPMGEEELDIDDVVLVEFQGSLAAICWDSEDEPFIFEIWGWNARGRFWSLVSTFDIPAAADPCTVVDLYNNDKSLVEDLEGGMLIYDHATRQHENLGLPSDGYMGCFPYVKSCVGPSSSN